MQASFVEVNILLRDLNYPLTKPQLIQQALKHGASHNVLQDLRGIPDGVYINSVSVIREFESIKVNWNNKPLNA